MHLMKASEPSKRRLRYLNCLSRTEPVATQKCICNAPSLVERSDYLNYPHAGGIAIDIGRREDRHDVSMVDSLEGSRFREYIVEVGKVITLTNTLALKIGIPPNSDV
ncbi:hypothetical protein MSS4_03400 [Mycobacterium marinum]|nr:hypothetical protein MSS4_03400 [Mycobacterium marinum]